MHSLTLASLCSALLLFVAVTLHGILRRHRHTPYELPGPTLLPYIGRVHDLPVQYVWLKFKEWADIYGPIYRTKMMGSTFVIVSDEQIAKDLLVTRAKINSDRPAVQSLFDSKSTFGSLEHLPLMGRNEHWARQRRWQHAHLMQATRSQYRGIMDYEVKRWMHRLLTEPDAFSDTLEDMASKVMCTLAWDDHTQSTTNTPSAMALLTQMSPAGPITNLLPFLWHLPEAINPWVKAERKRHAEQIRWWKASYAAAQSAGRQSCWARQAQDSMGKGLTSEHEAACCVGMLCLVGVLTVGGPLHYFLLAMVLHPEIQQRCQEEIDRVCGSRAPILDDAPQLPFLRACICETMRWRPNVPTGVAHEAEADHFYRGFLIEKGTRILPLDWAFLRNPKRYPDPDSFRPERWIEPKWPTYQEPLTKYPTVKGMTSFGWGQRQCLGQDVTQDELLVASSNLMWAFNLRHKVDPHTGLPIPIDSTKSSSLLIIKPDPFQMVIEPRSKQRRAAVVEAWEAASVVASEKVT